MKLRARCGKARYLETNGSDHENVGSGLEDDGMDGGNAMTTDGLTNEMDEVGPDAILPQSPYSISNNQKAHCTFLAPLSTDLKYQ